MMAARRPRTWLGGLLALGLAAPGWSGDAATQRVEELRAEVEKQRVVLKRLEAKLAAAERAARTTSPAPKRPPPRSSSPPPSPPTKGGGAFAPILGEVRIFGGTYVPRGWAACDGQLLPIAQYNALFSLLGTTYGGDGRTTFALPDLRGRLVAHAGHGPGLDELRQGGLRFTPNALVSSGGSPTTPWLGVRYILATEGIYPSRN